MSKDESVVKPSDETPQEVVDSVPEAQSVVVESNFTAAAVIDADPVSGPAAGSGVNPRRRTLSQLSHYELPAVVLSVVAAIVFLVVAAIAYGTLVLSL